jgi:penicillin amidase
VLLGALRSGGGWDEIAAALGVTEPEARATAAKLLRDCVPSTSGQVNAPGRAVRVVRDEWGIPHIFAEGETDTYFGLGLAMGQDRLWQMDFHRRLWGGTLAEVVGSTAIASDRQSRILGLRRVAEVGAAELSGEVLAAAGAFCAGVNLAQEQALAHGLPFEFRLLEYQPELWSITDTLTVLRGFWWQLTGRFPILCLPEFARRLLNNDTLFAAYLTDEGENHTIWPPELPIPQGIGGYASRGPGRTHSESPVPGSNNWVVAPSRSAGGGALLASDPHVPFGLPSVWYEARLRGGALDACGAFVVGVPGIFFGRNQNVAWGLTNNISSLRDLYVEVTEDFDATRYRRGEEWRGMTTRTETIRVRDAAPVTVEVLEVDHGPVVTELLPEYAHPEETVSLRWVGHQPTRELDVMLGYAHAGNVAQFREHLRDWHCPTFNFVMADRQGEIGYQLTGRLPLRQLPTRGYRPGDDPAHAWQGYVPYEGLPAFSNPPGGWLGSANNAVAPPEWPWPLSGTWPSDYRMQRIIEGLHGDDHLSAEDMAALQMDDLCLRAVEWAGVAAWALVNAGVTDELVSEIAGWDGAYTLESRPALVFEAFYLEWSRSVFAARLPVFMHAPLHVNAGGLVQAVLREDTVGWFESPEARESALRQSWEAALSLIHDRLGADRDAWEWGALHTLTLRHPLATSPALRELLERGPVPHTGTWNSLNNSLYEPDVPFATVSGVTYRLLADMAGATQAVNSGGQSGHPGSPRYADQVPLWADGRYHPLELTEPFEGDEWTISAE